MTNTQNNIKKVTPLHDRTWYVKWVSVGLIICAVLCRSVDEVPKFYDVVFSFLGTAGWLWVGYMWHDRALIFINSVAVFIYTTGILKLLLTSEVI